MKSGFVILLAGLFMLCLIPVQGVANQNTAVNFPVELGYDNFDQEKPAGPCRDDFGPDWIFYDTGQPELLWTGSNYWSRVTFTPNASFELRGARFMPLNQYDQAGECHVMVFTEDQDSRDLDEELIDFVIDRLPNWAGADDSWEDVEFDDEDFHTFEGGEHFSILYGPAPGGAYQAGNGWWCLYDSGTDVNRSFLADGDDPPTSHRTWENGEVAGDLLVRANGEYLDDFIDLAVVGLYNNTEKWLMYPGTEVVFTVRIENLGGEVEFPVVSFNFYDDEGNAVWDDPYEMIVESIEEEAVIEVECETIWTTEEIGNYFVEVIVMADEDANMENDLMSMEQVCINPADEEDAEMWVGYCSDQADSRVSGQDSTGWGVAWGHPGGNDALWVTAFAQYLQGLGNPVDCQFGLAVFTPADRIYAWAWIGTAELPANDARWLEVELEQDEIEATSFNSDQEIWLCYMNSGPVIQIDTRAPVAGQNSTDMPATNYSFTGWVGGAGDAGYGDHMARAKLAVSNIVPVGKLLRIEPEILDFGNVNVGEGIDIEATFTAFGDEPVTIGRLEIAGSADPYLTIDPNPDEEFIIEPQSSVTVTVTFYTDEAIELDSRIRVINDSDNMSNAFIWDVMANAQSVDDANRPVMPENYALYQNYPNPFNPTTSIEFALRSAGDVKLNVFDMNGKLVKEVVNNHLDAGYHTVEIDATDLAAGIYIYRLTTGDFTSARKMILMK